MKGAESTGTLTLFDANGLEIFERHTGLVLDLTEDEDNLMVEFEVKNPDNEAQASFVRFVGTKPEWEEIND